jgi:signal transduction histidine kinase
MSHIKQQHTIPANKASESGSQEAERTLAVIEQEKMAAVGKLAAGITHELNTPTTYIRANLQTFLRYHDMLSRQIDRLESETEVDRELIKKIREITNTMEDISRATLVGTDRIMTIIASMSGYIRENISEDRFINFMDPLKDAITLTWNRIKHAGKITINDWQYDPDQITSFAERHTFRLACNSQRICQLFVILINNSIDAWEETDRHSSHETGLEINIEINLHGDKLLCTFCDNAGGMKENVEKHVFEPFFSGHLKNKGTGLGMAIAGQIVKEHNGELILKNSYGQGVCWQITLTDRK